MIWYENDVEEAITERLSCPYEPKSIFYGSSSIRLWDSLYEDFEPYQPINLGFGGSTLAACTWFFDRIVAPVKHPSKIILYAGDNDLGDGRAPQEVLLFYKEFVSKLRNRFPDIPCYYISVKPSISRMDIIHQIQFTNKLIKDEIESRNANEYFVNVYDSMVDGAGKPLYRIYEQDGLHLNKQGYEIWKEIILKECFADHLAPAR